MLHCGKMELFHTVVMLLSFHNVFGENIFREQVIVFDKFESCKSGTLMEFVNITLRKDESRKTIVNATLRVNRDFDVQVEQIIKIIRCKSKDSPDSCENFMNMKLKNDCSMFNAKKQLWTTFYGRLQPQIQCPLKKGDYVVTNGFFDANYIPIKIDRNSYWKTYAMNYAIPTKEEVLCLYFEGGVQSKRN